MSKQKNTRFHEKDANKPESISPDRLRQLGELYDQELGAATSDRHGCKIARCRKSSNGYAQVSVPDGCGTGNKRKGKKEGSNKTPTYQLRHYSTRNRKFDTASFPNKGQDHSHLCGRGHLGCMSPEHIVVEDRKANLDRKDCQKAVRVGGVMYYVKQCDHEPKCIRPAAPVVQSYGAHWEL